MVTVPFGNALNVTLNALLASDQQKMNVLVANQRNFYIELANLVYVLKIVRINFMQISNN